MSTTARYTRQHYPTAADAVRDSLELHRELIAAVTEGETLFIEPAQVEFLARRVGQLLEAAVRSLEGQC